MTVTMKLLERNSSYREARPSEPLAIEPVLRALVLTCCDHRVDPAHVLGVTLGEAVVLRNAGGRVTPGLVQDLAILTTVAAIEGLDREFEFVIMHHTDCGTSRLSGDKYRGLLAGYFGIVEEDVPTKHVDNPIESVRSDIELLRANPFIPRTLIVSGLVFDVVTGRTEVICAPEPLGPIR